MLVSPKNVILTLIILCMFLCIWILSTHSDENDQIEVTIVPTEKSRHDKWIVVTTITDPTPDIKFLAEIPGWKVVVVGDKNTPSNWSHTNCVFLSLQAQQRLPFKSGKLIRTNTYARKTIGYLYAVAHGAEFIYETYDDNRPLDKLKSFTFSESTTGLLYVEKGLFNPYGHFGQSSLWPRGYPLNKIGRNKSSEYRLGKFKSAYIQQGVVNGKPDVDAVFRLTRMLTTAQLNVTFDNAAPPALLDNGVFSPFNSQNTLFQYDAFWAMTLPVTTTFKVGDIWRSFWAQRLLWEIDGRLAFYPPNAFQERNSNSYREDAKGEKDLYFQASALVDFLKSWKCPVNLLFFQCVNLLSFEMADRRFWGADDAKLIESWLSDLKSIGYVEPKRQPWNFSENINTSSTVIFHAAKKQPPHLLRTNSRASIFKWNQILGITSFCSKSTYKINNSKLIPLVINHILLIVVFNFPMYDNIRFLQLMYGVTFSNIVYCGNDAQAFRKASQNFQERVTFLEMDVFRGFYAYKCLAGAMKMGYRVKGYLMIGDDTLLNSWNLMDFPTEKIWYVPRTELLPLYRNAPSNWHWWNGPYGRVVYNKAWEQLRKMANSDDNDLRQQISKFTATLKINTGSPIGLFSSPSDILYIPKSYKKDTIFFMDVFSKYNVFLEIAIPTTIAGLDTYKNMFILKGQYLWYDGKREQVPSLFKSNDTYLHPVKLSAIKTSLNGFFCNTYFPLTFLNDKK